MVFRKKHENILEHNPDILIIQESENEEKLKNVLQKIKYSKLIWYGKNLNKGVAIITFNDYDISLSQDFNN